jgi:type VI secretion system protein ImpK
MSNTDPPSDPFAAFESDRTVIKPSAGRGPKAGTAAAPAAVPAAPGWA